MSESSHHTHDHICWGAHKPHPARHELRVESLSFSYRTTLALDNISFATTCGHSLALIGPNGAGKSTLLKALAGLLPKFGGQILWQNRPLRGSCREIAYLPQNSRVDWSFPLTVRGVVEMGRYPSTGMFGKFSRHDSEMVERALQTLDLLPLANRQIGSLSGGQQQRAFLARAIAQEAHVLLLDEPFTGLDRPSTQALSALIQSFTAEGRLVIASHHDLASAPDLFDSALLLNKSLIAIGPVRDVLTPEILQKTFPCPH